MDKFIHKYKELYEICKGTQEYFWKQVEAKVIDDQMLQKLSVNSSNNTEYYKAHIDNILEGVGEELSAKTAIVLLGIITTVITLKSDTATDKLRRFDTRIQEITSDYLFNPLLAEIIKQAETGDE